MTDIATRVADLLAEAARSGTPCEPVHTLFGDGDLATAYAAQEIATERRLASGARLVGRKIGLTSPAVQKQLGVGQPDYGMLFHDMDVANGDEVDLARLIQPKIEAEIAFVLGRDLDDARLTSVDVIAAIDWVLPALEVVDSRVAGWNIRITDTIADNASSGLFVLGHTPRRLVDVDVLDCGMVMERDGEPVSTGIGRACLGSPINATLWLARTMAAAGRPLKAGDVVLSGALGPMVPVTAGVRFEARIDGIGSVAVGFSGGEVSR